MSLTPSRLASLLAAGAAALVVTACAAPDRVVTGSLYPHDVRERHPIVLSDTNRSLDVFANGPVLDPRQRDDVKTFALEYRRYGKGALIAQVPVRRSDVTTHRAMQGVREALAEGGVTGSLAVSTYAPTDAGLAAPIRLTFARLQAGVSSRCGMWPQDLGVGDAGFNMRNEPYHNLGCAMQNNVAAQVADPLDLVRGRTEGRIDSVRRSRDIENLRQGKDPSTTYKQDEKGKINTQVAN